MPLKHLFRCFVVLTSTWNLCCMKNRGAFLLCLMPIQKILLISTDQQNKEVSKWTRSARHWVREKYTIPASGAHIASLQHDIHSHCLNVHRLNFWDPPAQLRGWIHTRNQFEPHQYSCEVKGWDSLPNMLMPQQEITEALYIA